MKFSAAILLILLLLLLALAGCAKKERESYTIYQGEYPRQQVAPGTFSGISVHILDSRTGSGISGSRVFFKPSQGTAFSGVAGPDGWFQQELRPGTYDLVATASGFRQETARILIEPGEHHRLTIRLSPSG